MPKQSEALILRTYPFHEADLLVTLFTRSEGKIRGVAKAAKRSKRRFGGALEPLTQRSRDNLPNPVLDVNNPYVPGNMPAIGDLFDMFQF